MSWNRISASIRLIMAMFRLYAGMEENWGRQVKDILRKQYPDAKDEISKAMSDGALGQKLLAIAMKQTQYNETKAQDTIQDAIMYWSTGTADYNSGKNKDKDPTPFDFTKGSPKWEDALNNMFSNLRHRAMSFSQGYTKKEKRERSVDDAFGQRGEDGGSPEGGEARMPTPDDQTFGKALDDKAGIKEFIDLIDEALPDLKAFLASRGDDQLKLFELVFDGDVGGFGSDVKDNMNQATAMKEKYPELYAKNAKRWSGYVGDLRKKVLAGIWEFVETHLAPGEYEALYEAFFSDTTPQAVEKNEEAKGAEKEQYQQGIDERKLAKWKWMEQQGTLDPKSKKSYDALAKKLKGQGIDVDSIPAAEKPEKDGWVIQKKTGRAAFSLEGIAARIASTLDRTGT